MFVESECCYHEQNSKLPDMGVVVLLGLAAFTTLAIHRGEQVSAVWMVIAAVSVYAIAYRFYSLYIAKNVMQLDPNRLTPAEAPLTMAWTMCRRTKACCSAIICRHPAGAGPLVGPVLAAQMGYLPRHAVDYLRRGVCRCSTGHDGLVRVHAP